MKSLDKKEQLRDYYTNPTHKYFLEGVDKKRIFSQVCDEWLEAYVQVVDHKVKAAYDVRGCAISTSSTEAVARIIDGMDYDDAVKLLKDFKIFLEDQEKNLPEAFGAFDFLTNQKSRIKCVLFPVNEFLEKLDESNNI